MSLDITDTLAPDSAQVNADDFAGRTAVVTVAGAEKIAGDRPLAVHLHEFPGRPLKPGKTVRRILAAAGARAAAGGAPAAVVQRGTERTAGPGAGITQRPERPRGLEVVAGTGQHPNAGKSIDEGLGHSGLPDAGFTGQQDYAASPGDRLAPHRVEGAEDL